MDNSTVGRSVYSSFPNVTSRRIQGDFFINQLFTEHGSFGLYQKRFFGKDSSCVFCLERNAGVLHLIYECKFWEEKRNEVIPVGHRNLKIEILVQNRQTREFFVEILRKALEIYLEFGF